MNVLLVDDDACMLAMLQRLLVKWGHEVDACFSPTLSPAYYSPACPCALIETGCPDVILTDVNMPLVNGVKFIEELKRKGCKCPKIGMMSGDWHDSDLLIVAHMGVTVFDKPFDLSILRSWVSEEVPVVDPAR